MASKGRVAGEDRDGLTEPPRSLVEDVPEKFRWVRDNLISAEEAARWNKKWERLYSQEAPLASGSTIAVNGSKSLSKPDLDLG
jgi:hypothetical protein